MTESQFKTKAVKLMRKELPGAWIYHPSDKWISGIPDLLILWRGIFAAIELKIAPNRATRLQEIVLGKITAAGGITRICFTMEDIRCIIDVIKGEDK